MKAWSYYIIIFQFPVFQLWIIFYDIEMNDENAIILKNIGDIKVKKISAIY